MVQKSQNLVNVVFERPLWRKNYFNELQKLIKHVLRMTNDGMYLAEGHGYLCGIPSTGILQDNCSSWVVCTFFVAVGYVHFFKCAEKMVLAMLIVVKV